MSKAILHTKKAEEIGKDLLKDAHAIEDGHISARRLAAYMRVIAMASPGGPLNYLEQMRPIRERFLLNLADAYARFKAAATGLKDYYAYPLALPTPKEADQNGRSLIDLLVAWVQQTGSFLTRFGQRDQGHVATVSVRRALTDATFDTVLTGAAPTNKERLSFAFEMPARLFSDLFFVRLRGVGLYLVAKSGQEIRGVFSATVRPPRRGKVVFFTNPLSLETQPFTDSFGFVVPVNVSSPWQGSRGLATRQGAVELDQVVPIARSGRIGPRAAERDADIVGTVAFSNLSPIGVGTQTDNRTWLIEVGRWSTQGEDFAAVIHDLEIDLHVAYQESFG